MTALVFAAPQSMGSKKAFKIGNRAVVVDANVEKLRSFQAEVKDQMRLDKPEQIHLGPIVAQVFFWLPRPKGHYGSGKNARMLKSSAPARPTTKPDADKVLRAILDCMTGIWIKDDAQVVSVRLEKYYVEEGEEVRTWIQARPL